MATTLGNLLVQEADLSSLEGLAGASRALVGGAPHGGCRHEQKQKQIEKVSGAAMAVTNEGYTHATSYAMHATN